MAYALYDSYEFTVYCEILLLSGASIPELPFFLEDFPGISIILHGYHYCTDNVISIQLISIHFNGFVYAYGLLLTCLCSSLWAILLPLMGYPVYASPNRKFFRRSCLFFYIMVFHYMT